MKSVLAFSLDEIKLGNTNKTIGTTYGEGGISILISAILKYSLMLASIILLSLLIFGGITFIMSAGKDDPKKASQGKSAITNALIGFAIVLFAFSIIRIIETITGLHILDSTL